MFNSAPEAVRPVIVSCFQANQEVRAEVSALSVLRLEKLVLVVHLNDAPVIQSFNVVIVLIVF
jgi:hypothetical protein